MADIRTNVNYQVNEKNPLAGTAVPLGTIMYLLIIITNKRILFTCFTCPSIINQNKE